jgi:hypothetical protein
MFVPWASRRRTKPRGQQLWWWRRQLAVVLVLVVAGGGAGGCWWLTLVDMAVQHLLVCGQDRDLATGVDHSLARGRKLVIDVKLHVCALRPPPPYHACDTTPSHCQPNDNNNNNNNACAREASTTKRTANKGVECDWEVARTCVGISVR